MPNDIKIIPEDCFRSCESLDYISIPANVTSIGYVAFAGCVRIVSIIIPSCVNNIEADAFKRCTSLTDVYSLNEDPPICDKYTFDRNTLIHGTLHVKRGTRDKYASSEGWKRFSLIEEDA